MINPTGDDDGVEQAKAARGCLLILGPHDICEPCSGAELRSYHLARQLSAFLRVVYLFFRREPGGELERRALPGLGERPLEAWRVPRPPMYTVPKLLRGLLGRTPLALLNYTCPAMRNLLEEVLRQGRFEFLHIEGVHMSGYLKGVLRRPDRPRGVVGDWHNVESELLRQYGRHQGSLARRLYAAQTAVKTRVAERAFLRRADAHLVVREQDRRTLLALEPRAKVWVVENGVDVGYFAAPEDGEQRRFRVLFVGAMDYHANIEAAVRFAREVWPLVRERPELVLTIVGRSPAPEVRALAAMPGVEVTGTVADVRPFYREALAQVVPLRIGGGTRLKILESMAAGVPVVTTAVGAEGLRARPGEHYLLAESPQDFRDCIGRLAEDVELGHRLAESARELVRRHYDWSVVCTPLREIYAGLTVHRAPN